VNRTVAPQVGGPSLPQERRVVTAVPGFRSQALDGRRNAAVARGVSSVLRGYVTAAGGGVLVDADDNVLIDFASGIAVTSVGNSADAVVRNVRQQVAAFTHTCFMVSPYESYVAVCEALNRLTPGRHEKRSALFNSGAEAVENAVKIARVHTGRSAVVVLDHGYHGRTNLTMAMTAKNMPYKNGFGPFASEVYRVPASYPFREPRPITGTEAAARAISDLDRQIGAGNVACLVFEPIAGEGGFIVPATGFLPTLAAYCRDKGILFVADEIQTGIARTGTWFACEHEGVVPDLVTVAKGLAGGLPLAGVTGRAEVMDSVHPGGLGGTYGGNPIACAAALGAIQTIEEEGLLAQAHAIGDILTRRLAEIQANFPAIGDVRGRGAMVAVEIVRPGTLAPDPDTTRRVAAACHAEGLLVLTAGSYGNVLRFLPPLVIPHHLVVEGLDILAHAFAKA